MRMHFRAAADPDSHLPVVHCLSGSGQVNESGQLKHAEKEKHRRYRTVVNGVRVTPARLVPIALSSLGAVGGEARAFFSLLGSNACLQDEDGEGPLRCRGLVELCSFLAVMFSARNAMAAYISPDNGPAGRRRRA